MNWGGFDIAKPCCFISYAWERNEHKDWVGSLAERLVENGVETFLDQWDIEYGSDIPEYMETCVRESDFVILICTPTFAERANTGKGGVGYVKHIVTGDVYEGVTSPRKFVPLLRRGTPEKSFPSYLKSKYYIDFREDSEFDLKLEDLVRHIYKSPKYKRPPIGKPPTFTIQDNRPLTPINPPKQMPVENLTIAIREVTEFAGSCSGMSLSITKVKEFTEWWVEHCIDRDFEEFKEVYQYASSFSGMYLSRTEAVEFGKLWMTEYVGKDFENFQELYSHAHSYVGMALSRKEAIQFALKMVKRG